MTFSNKELEKTYHTVEALMAHDGFAKMIQYIAKQDGRVKMTINVNQRRRGRNG